MTIDRRLKRSAPKSGEAGGPSAQPESMTAARPPRLLRRHQVEDMVGLKRAAIYQLQRTGRFPHNVKIGTRAVAWFEEDILRWLAERRQGRPC